jgi:hypothetical protein
MTSHALLLVVGTLSVGGAVAAVLIIAGAAGVGVWLGKRRVLRSVLASQTFLSARSSDAAALSYEKPLRLGSACSFTATP